MLCWYHLHQWELHDGMLMLITLVIVMVVDDEDDAGLCLVGDLKSGEGEGKLLNQDTLSSTLQRTAL